MATYTELRTLFDDGDLMGRIAVAVIVAADGIRANVSATDVQKAWANRAVRDTLPEAQKALKLALAQNKALTVVQIKAATDASLQTAVDNVVPLLVTA